MEQQVDPIQSHQTIPIPNLNVVEIDYPSPEIVGFFQQLNQVRKLICPFQVGQGWDIHQ